MGLSSDHKDLLERLAQGKLSPEEATEVIILLSNDADPEGAELLQKHLQTSNAAPVSAEITASLDARLAAVLNTPVQRSLPRYIRRAVAVAAVALIAAASWLVLQQSSQVKITPSAKAGSTEILPGHQGAILTLDDNRTIVLDSMGNGLIATQNGSKVILNNGKLNYDKANSSSTGIAYNTMSTPRGRQFQLQLSDGTKVWLDAASSIKFPTAFLGNERQVEISGEVYFEVAKDKSKPFIVSIKDNATRVEVLGTHFNIDAYKDEATVNTTLFEGSVKVSTGNNHHTIRPGQQAQSGDQTKVINDVNLRKVLAWKDGVFDFGDTNLETVMRQLERWYDIEVVYENGIPPFEFVGKMRRDLSLSEVLRGLEMSEVHFRLEGRKVIIVPSTPREGGGTDSRKSK